MFERLHWSHDYLLWHSTVTIFVNKIPLQTNVSILLTYIHNYIYHQLHWYTHHCNTDMYIHCICICIHVHVHVPIWFPFCSEARKILYEICESILGKQETDMCGSGRSGKINASLYHDDHRKLGAMSDCWYIINIIRITRSLIIDLKVAIWRFAF